MQKTQTICLVVLTTIATGFSLYYLKTVLLPFIISLFIVIGNRPILKFFQDKLKLHWFLSFVVTFSIGVALMVGFACLVWLSIYDLGMNSKAYEKRLEVIARWVQTNVAESMAPDELAEDPAKSQSGLRESKKSDNADATQSLGGPGESTAIDAPGTQAGSDDAKKQNRPNRVNAANEATKPIDEMMKNLTNLIKGQMLNLAGSLSSLLSYVVLILIFVFFMLLENRNRLVAAPTDTNSTRGIVGEVEEQIRKYLVVKTIISVLTGLVFGFFLWLFGVPLAILFGFLAFLLNYIPNFGPLIAILLPTPFLVLNAEISPTSAAICFALISTTQFVSGNVIETRIMGKSFDVSPVVLLLALMFFGLIWGILGMFLATPIVSVIKIILQGIPSGRFLADIIAGRWDGRMGDSSNV